MGDSFSWREISSGPRSRQHNGNVYNNKTYNYSTREKKDDLNLEDQERSHSFLKAAAEGQLRRVEYLIRLGVDLDYTDEDNMTALHHAAYSGYEDVVETLIFEGCDVNAYSDTKGTPLQLASTMQRKNVVEMLRAARGTLNTAGTGQSSRSSKTPILSSGSVPRFAAKLPQLPPDLDPRFVGEKGETAMHIAARQGNEEYIRLLLLHGCSPHSRDKNGSTPLHFAISSGNFDSTGRILVDAGAPLNACDGNNDSPLSLTCQRGFIEDVRTLIKAGAPVTVGALYKTIVHGERVDIVRLLLQNRANIDLDLELWDGRTLLDLPKDSEIIRLLTSSGAKVWHAELGSPGSIATRLDYGCSITARDSDGNTALARVMRKEFRYAHQKEAAIQMLVDAGARDKRVRFSRA